jgi:hypothetical protein
MRLLFVGLIYCAGCGGNNAATQGELGGHCYPNGTCNVTLSCSGGICVAAVADADTSAMIDAAPDALVNTASDAYVLPVDAAVDAAVDAPPVPPDANCETLNPGAAPDGHHNQDMACIAAGCHLLGSAGAGAPPYSYAGTLHTDATGTTPLAGATVFVKLGGVRGRLSPRRTETFSSRRALMALSRQRTSRRRR